MMIKKSSFSRLSLLGSTVVAVSGFIALPGTAEAGFFDQLFGGAPSQPAYQYEQPPQSEMPAEPFVTPHRRVVKKVVVDDKPVLQKTTDLLHDKTLRAGDAVMMKNGIHIYTGHETASHRTSEFAPLDEARRIAPAQKTVLAALDGTRNDPLAKAAKPDTIASGRSAAVSTPIVAGVKFTDQRGITIRYVGP